MVKTGSAATHLRVLDLDELLVLLVEGELPSPLEGLHHQRRQDPAVQSRRALGPDNVGQRADDGRGRGGDAECRSCSTSQV